MNQRDQALCQLFQFVSRMTLVLRVNPDQILSDDDLPTAVGREDRRQVIRIRDVPPEVLVVKLSQKDPVSDTRLAAWKSEQLLEVPDATAQSPVHTVTLPLEVWASNLPPGAGAVDLTLVVRAADVPPVARMETVQPVLPPDAMLMSPNSPQTVACEDMAVSSVPISPNRVREDCTQDIPDEGTVFEVSPDF